MDVGCYCVSAMRLLGGEPERVSGRQVTRDGVDVRFAGTLALPGGVLGVFDCGLDMVDALAARGGRDRTARSSCPIRGTRARAGSRCAGPAGPRS